MSPKIRDLPSLTGPEYRYLGHFAKAKFQRLGHNTGGFLWSGMASKGPKRHNERSSTVILPDGKAYNISSADNDRQQTLTREDALRLGAKRGYGKAYDTTSQAVDAAIKESKEAGDPKNAIEMYEEHRGKRR